jgi:hypothetical protein
MLSRQLFSTQNLKEHVSRQTSVNIMHTVDDLQDSNLSLYVTSLLHVELCSA